MRPQYVGRYPYHGRVSDKTTVALALGSGGARGFAHIGVIQVLEERGFEIVNVAGSSMGAVVGGIYASEKLAEYTEWAVGLTQFDVVRLLDVSVSAPGAIRAERVLAIVHNLLDGARIEDLPIPFTAVATDLFARKEVWFQKGLVETAIRASIAIPGVITPVMLNGRLLADGGIMDPVPIAPTAASRADLTIAVSLSGEYRDLHESDPVLDAAEVQPVEEWTDRFRRTAAGLLDGDLVRSLASRFGGDADATVEPGVDAAIALDEAFEKLPDGLSKFDMMNLSLESMQSLLTRYRLAGYPPDVLVSVPKDACRTLDFHRGADMVALGRRLTTEALDKAGYVEEPATDANP